MTTFAKPLSTTFCLNNPFNMFLFITGSNILIFMDRLPHIQPEILNQLCIRSDPEERNEYLGIYKIISINWPELNLSVLNNDTGVSSHNVNCNPMFTASQGVWLPVAGKIDSDLWYCHTLMFCHVLLFHYGQLWIWQYQIVSNFRQFVKILSPQNMNCFPVIGYHSNSELKSMILVSVLISVLIWTYI